jgi:hypothetical protein
MWCPSRGTAHWEPSTQAAARQAGRQAGGAVWQVGTCPTCGRRSEVAAQLTCRPAMTRGSFNRSAAVRGKGTTAAAAFIPSAFRFACAASDWVCWSALAGFWVPVAGAFWVVAAGGLWVPGAGAGTALGAGASSAGPPWMVVAGRGGRAGAVLLPVTVMGDSSRAGAGLSPVTALARAAGASSPVVSYIW